MSSSPEAQRDSPLTESPLPDTRISASPAPDSPQLEAGHDPQDHNRASEGRDTPEPPIANPTLDMDASENDDDENMSDSDLSEVDEAQFQDFDPANVAIEDRPAIQVDESNVALLGVHKRKRTEGADGEEAGKKKRKEGRREKPKKSRKPKGPDDEPFSGGEELEGKRRKKSSGSGERKERSTAKERTPENEEELSPEERRRRAIDRAMDEALKNPNKRRRKLDGDSLEEAVDDIIAHMRDRMEAAARADNDNRSAGHAAYEKLKLLPEVVALLNRNTFQHALVDPEANIMQAVRFFLEPLNDGSLPAYNIQRDLFAALAKLPINQDTLIASGIGKVVLFYSKSKRPEVSIKRQAERLLGEWSRPILKRTDDYRKRAMVSAEYDPTRLPIRSSQPVIPATQTAAEARKAARAIPPRNTNRARVREGVSSYSIVPKSVVTSSQNQTIQPIGASADSNLRRMLGKTGAGRR